MPSKQSPSGMSIWWMAARPKTLFAGLCPVIMGTMIAFKDQHFHLLSALGALLGALLIQIGTNFANDYFDFKKGADTPNRLGPTRVTSAGFITPATMLKATIITFMLAAAVGSYLILRGGWPIVWIGIASLLSGILYTGGPFPLGYLGLGDLFVLIFFGPIAVAGTYYVQALSWSLPSILLGFSPGLFSVAILTANNLRDVREDSQSHKKTLVVRFGKTFGKSQYLISVMLACFLPAILYGKDNFLTYLCVFTIMAAQTTFKRIWNQEGQILNQALADTGKLLLLFTFLFCVAWRLK